MDQQDAIALFRKTCHQLYEAGWDVLAIIANHEEDTPDSCATEMLACSKLLLNGESHEERKERHNALLGVSVKYPN